MPRPAGESSLRSSGGEKRCGGDLGVVMGDLDGWPRSAGQNAKQQGATGGGFLFF